MIDAEPTRQDLLVTKATDGLDVAPVALVAPRLQQQMLRLALIQLPQQPAQHLTPGSFLSSCHDAGSDDDQRLDGKVCDRGSDPDPARLVLVPPMQPVLALEQKIAQANADFIAPVLPDDSSGQHEDHPVGGPPNALVAVRT